MCGQSRKTMSLNNNFLKRVGKQGMEPLANLTLYSSPKPSHTRFSPVRHVRLAVVSEEDRGPRTEVPGWRGPRSQEVVEDDILI